MSWDWKETVRSVAPTIARALGGPLAGQAVAALGNALLGKPDATEDEVAAAVKAATPEQLLALKQEDHRFAEQMRKLDIDLEKIHAGDRDSARRRQAATGDKTPQVLAYLYTAGFFVLLAFLAWAAARGLEIPATIQRTLDTTLGVMFAMMLASKDYFFGSSSGSRRKDELIKR